MLPSPFDSMALLWANSRAERGRVSAPYSRCSYAAWDSMCSSSMGLNLAVASPSTGGRKVLELLLLHFPHILAQSLRNTALEKKRRRVEAEREKWMKRRSCTRNCTLQCEQSIQTAFIDNQRN
mmetsp:Transcript_44794/g.95343  ORF Transcript_44794/g.95343 Transcript_44794/m.95343 type:complete len:123 (+) Transcript_44794:445-813(+)